MKAAIGNESFSYTVSDGQASATGTVNLTVVAVPPVADNLYRTLWDHDDSLTLNLVSDVSAPAGEILTVAALGAPHEGSVTLNCVFHGSPATDSTRKLPPIPWEGCH